MDAAELISEILQLDQETYAGIDNPAFLYEMSIQELRDYLDDMYHALHVG